MSFRLGDSHLEVLEDVAFFRFLTCKQFARLRHPKSLSHAQEKMRMLKRAGYLRREPLDHPRTNRTARTEDVYALDVKGAHVLHKLGVQAHLEPQKEHSYLFLRHTLGVNDVLIAAKRLAIEKLLTMERMRHEKDLKEDPLLVEQAGKEVAVTPDGSLRLSYAGQHYIVILEYDRGTEQESAVWQDKVWRMLLLTKQLLRQEFPHAVIVMATAVVPRDGSAAQRVATLLRWTHDEVVRWGTHNQDCHFYFSSVDPWAEPEDQHASLRYWLDPHWQVAGRLGGWRLLDATP